MSVTWKQATTATSVKTIVTITARNSERRVGSLSRRSGGGVSVPMVLHRTMMDPLASVSS